MNKKLTEFLEDLSNDTESLKHLIIKNKNLNSIILKLNKKYKDLKIDRESDYSFNLEDLLFNSNDAAINYTNLDVELNAEFGVTIQLYINELINDNIIKIGRKIKIAHSTFYYTNEDDLDGYYLLNFIKNYQGKFSKFRKGTLELLHKKLAIYFSDEINMSDVKIDYKNLDSSVIKLLNFS